jgi:hypothetical protein
LARLWVQQRSWVCRLGTLLVSWLEIALAKQWEKRLLQLQWARWWGLQWACLWASQWVTP